MKQVFTQLAALINASDIGFDGPMKDGNLMHTVLNAIYFWAGVIAVIVIIVAGFLYTTSNGDSSQMTRAKNAILGACIGLVIIILAFAITSIVLGAL